MDIKEIKHFLKLMDAYGLCEFTLEGAEGKISLKRPMAPAYQPAPPPAMQPVTAVPAVPPAPAAPADAGVSSKTGSAPAAPEDGEKLLAVKAPIVGTFYAATSPDAPPLAYEGLAVSEDSTVGIIESMKIMSEIKAEVSGTIAKVCVGNGQPVEFGQTLFLVRPE